MTTIIVKKMPSGEEVIVDPTITQSRIYHYFYLFINIGALVGQIGMVYAEKYVGFWLSFTLPTIMFFFCPIVMVYCRNVFPSLNEAQAYLFRIGICWPRDILSNDIPKSRVISWGYSSVGQDTIVGLADSLLRDIETFRAGNEVRSCCIVTK